MSPGRYSRTAALSPSTQKGKHARDGEAAEDNEAPEERQTASKDAHSTYATVEAVRQDGGCRGERVAEMRSHTKF